MENQLKKMANYNKKHNKGRGWFMKKMSADPQKGIEFFNNASSGTPSSTGGECCSGMAEELEIEPIDMNARLKHYVARIKEPDGTINYYENEESAKADLERLKNYYNKSKNESLNNVIETGYFDGNKVSPDSNSYETWNEFRDRLTKKYSDKYMNVKVKRTKSDTKGLRAYEVTGNLDENLGKGKDEIFSLIKEINHNAKEENYKNMDVNRMLAVYYNMRERAAKDKEKQELQDIDINDIELGEKVPFTGVKMDWEDGQLYHYQNGERGEVATEEESEPEYFEK